MPRPRRALPAFALYGEAAAQTPQLLHIEPVQSRSRLYRWEIESHVHRGLHQVVWLHSGPVQVLLDESRSQVQGPVAIVIPPGVAHAFKFSAASDGFVLTVNATLLTEGDVDGAGDALQALFAAPQVLALDAGSPEVARLQPLFEALLAEAGSADAPATPVPRWLARAVVWRLSQLALRDEASGANPRSPQRSAQRSLYTRWVVLLEAHFLVHWPVSRYAERLGLSTERLNRMLRAETGQGAQALLHARLAREACRRLVHVAAPVSKLGFELGFEDPAYFCRFFKRQAGLSPRAYRAQALGANAGQAPRSVQVG